MKMFTRIVLAVVTAGACAAAGAQSYVSDQQRRDRNREEAMAHHDRMMNGSTTGDRSAMRDSSVRDSSARDSSLGEKTRDKARTVRSKTHQAAQSTRSFTHRQVEKVRNFGERQQRKFPARESRPEINKDPAALGK